MFLIHLRCSAARCLRTYTLQQCSVGVLINVTPPPINNVRKAWSYDYTAIGGPGDETALALLIGVQSPSADRKNENHLIYKVNIQESCKHGKYNYYEIYLVANKANKASLILLSVSMYSERQSRDCEPSGTH